MTASLPPRARARAVPVALLGASVIVGVAALWPAYLGGRAVSADPSTLFLDAVLLAGWAAAVALLLLRPATGSGAGLAVGVTVAALGVRGADWGQAGHGGSGAAPGAGFWLTVAAWALAAAGSAAAVRASAQGGDLGRPDRPPLALAAAAAAAAALTAIAFVPGWDVVRVVLRAEGNQSFSGTNPNAFTAPWEVIVGNVAVVVAIAVLPLAGVVWRPRRFGTGLFAGLIVMMVGQLGSALVLSSTAVSATLFVPPAEVTALGAHARYLLNGWFALEVEGVFALLVVWVARLLTPDRRIPPPPRVPGDGTPAHGSEWWREALSPTQ